MVPVLADPVFETTQLFGLPWLGHSDLRSVTVFETQTRSACCAPLLYHSRHKVTEFLKGFFGVFVSPWFKTGFRDCLV
jgi:hypothetical protein